MARRKNGFMSDGSDSDASSANGSDGGFNSQEDEDSRAERALFEHRRSKKRRTGNNGKAAAWEGIFGEEEDAPRRFNGGGIGARGKGKQAARTDWTKAPQFVSKSTADLEAAEKARSKATTPEEDDETPSSDGSDSDSDSDSLASAPPSPRVRENDYDEGTQTSGTGLGGLGARRGLGSSTSAGSSFPKPVSDEASEGRNGEPSQPRERSAFQNRETPRTFIAPKPNLTATEAAHFRRIDNNFGSKFLQKLGWSAGEGLGKDKSGRAVPIEAGKHMRGVGIMSGMRTEDSKREARRRGEIVSDDEEEKARKAKAERRKAGPSKENVPQEQSWRKQRKVKVKVEHKTYEQLLEESGEVPSGPGLVIDARGGELREVESLSALNLSGWTPTSDATQLPELRHNLRLIVDVTKADVDALVKEGRAVNEKRRWAAREEQTANSRMEKGVQTALRLEQIQVHIADITTLVDELAKEASPSLDALGPSFDALINEYSEEYAAMELDDVVVGAIAQVVGTVNDRAYIQLRRPLAEWKPFDESSDVLLAALKTWRHAYRLHVGDAESGRTEGRVMTAWESFLSGSWLPKVRSAINNHWSPTSPQPAVHLLESWAPILPAFIRDNVLDQLILPKVKQSIEDWDARPRKNGKTPSLSSMVFPWLPLLDYRVEDMLDGAKRRLRQVMRKWSVRDGIPEELGRWRKDVFTSKEWDELMLRNVVPKLAVSLRDDFEVNPRKQDMVPLEEWTMPWHRLLRASTFSQLLEVNFFPKWLEILYIWLVQPNFKADEVANWFTWWKSRFPDEVLSMPGIAHGFTSGLKLMEEAMRLGSDAPTRLKKPDYDPLQAPKQSNVPKPAPVHRPAKEATEITFRSLAEDYATKHDLILLPIGRSHADTGKPLLKVCKSVDGRGGITVYVGDDAVFAQTEDGTFKAVSLDDMVKRALA